LGTNKPGAAFGQSPLPRPVVQQRNPAAVRPLAGAGRANDVYDNDSGSDPDMFIRNELMRSARLPAVNAEITHA